MSEHYRKYPNVWRHDDVPVYDYVMHKQKQYCKLTEQETDIKITNFLILMLDFRCLPRYLLTVIELIVEAPIWVTLTTAAAQIRCIVNDELIVLTDFLS